MIPYSKSFLGLNLIFRINGSPVYRAAIPGIMSVIIFCLLEKYNNYYTGDGDLAKKYVIHPYGVGVLISSVSFLIVFRANYGYQRYWNACGDVHQMMSKWLDAVTHTGVFHMQCHHYDHIKPPSYFDTHDLNQYGFNRDRECEVDFRRMNKTDQHSYRKLESVVKSIDKVKSSDSMDESVGSSFNKYTTSQKKAIHDPTHLLSEGRKDGGWGPLFNDETSTYYNMKDPDSWRRGEAKGFASTVGGRTPSLFLQELIHLASLTVAVAFSTLRSDIEGTEAPLDMYKPGSPWPEVDPDKLKKGKGSMAGIKDSLMYLTGFDKSPAKRTEHNAMRPLPVIGGVSENEIAFLQRARGPSAKVTLAWHWLSEHIIREHLAGSLGDVGPPIISRIIQFLSDGMIFYNHARKTMFIPFPFPHAQISAFFTFTIMVTVPLLMDEYATDLYIGAALTFLTVTCLAGLHEVARELENPFRNVPNEIPLVTLLAMFNESLITLYAGYHPDLFYDPDEYREIGKNRKRAQAEEFAAHEDTFSVKTTDTPLRENRAPEQKPQSVETKAASVDELRKMEKMEKLEELVKAQQDEIGRLNDIVEEKKVDDKSVKAL